MDTLVTANKPAGRNQGIDKKNVFDTWCQPLMRKVLAIAHLNAVWGGIKGNSTQLVAGDKSRNCFSLTPFFFDDAFSVFENVLRCLSESDLEMSCVFYCDREMNVQLKSNNLQNAVSYLFVSVFPCWPSCFSVPSLIASLVLSQPSAFMHACRRSFLLFFCDADSENWIRMTLEVQVTNRWKENTAQEEKEVKKNKTQGTSEAQRGRQEAPELQTYKSTPTQVEIKQDWTWILSGLALLEMTPGHRVGV